jgi:hypothetical protein
MAVFQLKQNEPLDKKLFAGSLFGVFAATKT